MTRDIVLFLGAGFSNDAGVPTMSAFGKFSAGEISDIQRPGHINRNIIPRLLEAGHAFCAFQEYCKKSDMKIDSDNMEEIFCIAESLKQCGIREIVHDNKIYKIDYLLEQIRLWLWKIYTICRPIDDHGDKNNQNYLRLFKILGRPDINSRITIVTTNYDLITEYFLFRESLKFCYPLSGVTPEIQLIPAGNRSSYERYFWMTGGIPICKLHGSVNYFTQNVGMESGKLYVVDDIADENETIGKSRIPSRRPAIFAQDALWNMDNRSTHKFIPAIIPPTYEKLRSLSWLEAIWNCAFEAVTHAEKVLFLGYSFPKSDGFMVSMFKAASTMNLGKKPKIMVVNQTDNNFKNYADIFKDLDGSLYQGGLASNIDKIEEFITK